MKEHYSQVHVIEQSGDLSVVPAYGRVGSFWDRSDGASGRHHLVLSLGPANKPILSLALLMDNSERVILLQDGDKFALPNCPVAPKIGVSPDMTLVNYFIDRCYDSAAMSVKNLCPFSLSDPLYLDFQGMSETDEAITATVIVRYNGHLSIPGAKHINTDDDLDAAIDGKMPVDPMVAAGLELLVKHPESF